MDSREFSQRKTPNLCEKDDEGQKSPSIPKLTIPDSGKTLSPGKTPKEKQNVKVHDNVKIDESTEIHINQFDQQGHQSLQNEVSKSGKDKSKDTLLENAYLHVRPSTSQDQDKSHETGKTEETSGPLDSEIDTLTTSSDSSNSEDEEYFSFEGEKYSSDKGDEIQILSVTQIDDREPCQDHVAEKFLYCESCAERIEPITYDLIPEAKRMCFYCELYMCSECASRHSEHLTLHLDEHENLKDHHISEMVKTTSLLLEDDDKRQRAIAKSRHVICGRIDVRMSREPPSSESCKIRAVCISMDGKLLVVTDESSNSVKVFNMYNHKMIQYIQLSSTPHGVAEIPHLLIQEHFADGLDNLEINSSHTYIAVTFPIENRILIIDFAKNNARIVHAFQIFGTSGCREIFLCNGILITYCAQKNDHEIKFLTMKGIPVRTIDILKLPFPGFSHSSNVFHIAVHEESETIYICCPHYVSMVGVKIHGDITEAAIYKSNETPKRIHVDSDRNVFVSTDSTSFYKITDHLNKRQQYIPSNPSIVSNNQWSCIHTSWKGKLFCVDSNSPSYFVNIIQSEPSFFSDDKPA